MVEKSNEANASVPQEAMNHLAAADCFTLLAMLLQPPTAESVELLKHPELAEDFASISTELGIEESERLKVAKGLAMMSANLSQSDDALGIVRREYTRLFAHPKKPVIQLYEGVFIDDELVNEGKQSTYAFLFVNPAAKRAEEAYREAGFASVLKSKVPADCITTEMQFVEQLHIMAAKAIIEGDEGAAKEAEERLARFHAERTARWIPRFFERCVEESRIDLYSLLGKVGLLFMEAELSPASKTQA